MRVASVNISEKKGTIKHPVDEIIIDMNGIKGDAHYGMKNRSISILGEESIKVFEKSVGRKINYGEFAENITFGDTDLKNISLLDRFIIGDTELEVSQIGKKCHGDRCAIYKEAGDCIMPKQGIFCKVLSKGTIKPGISVEYIPKVYSVTVITLSDRAFSGEYADRSGPKIIEIAENYFHTLNLTFKSNLVLIPDNADQLRKHINIAVRDKIDVIITTGGTGLAPSDLTPDTVKPMLDREIPGIMEMIRIKYGNDNPNALLSRGIAGTIGKTLVYTLPGSMGAVQDYMTEINKTLLHLVYTIHGLDLH